VTENCQPALIEQAETALAASTDRVVFVPFEGRRYVAKRFADHRPRPRLQSLALRWLVKRITGQALPMDTLRLADADFQAGGEARRLRSLAQVGVRVPPLVHVGTHYLLMPHCGEPVADLLADWPIDTIRSELVAQAADLGRFHRDGQWHGAAQIKNLTWQDGQTWRIDFEESFGEQVPLPVAQALDVVLFLDSIALAGPLDETESRRLLPRLLEAWAAQQPGDAVIDVLRRGERWLARLAWLSLPFRRRTRKGRPRKGALRLAIVSDAMTQFLKASGDGRGHA